WHDGLRARWRTRGSVGTHCFTQRAHVPGYYEIRAPLGQLENGVERIDLVDHPAPRAAPQRALRRQATTVTEDVLGLEGFVLQPCVIVICRENPRDWVPGHAARRVYCWEVHRGEHAAGAEGLEHACDL